MADTPTTPTNAPAAPTAPNAVEGAALLYASPSEPTAAVPAEAPEPVAEGTVSDEAPSAALPPKEAGAEGAVGTLATGAEGEEAKPAVDAPPEEAPLSLASYEVKLPEGFTPAPDLLDKFKETALASKLDPKAAQSFIDLYASAMQTASGAAQTAAEALSAQWRTETLALPEFTGATRDASLQSLGRFMDEYGSPDLKSVLDATGLGNNPHVVRAFLKAAQALDEGRPVAPGAPANPGPNNGKPMGQRTPGQILYSSEGPGSLAQQ